MYFNYLQPMAERTAAFEILHAEKGLHKYFLRQVFGYAFIARDVAAVGYNSALVHLNQSFESP